MKRNKFNSIMFNEKIRKDIFRYNPDLCVNRTVNTAEKNFLYPIVDNIFNNKTTWNILPNGLTMDQDSCLIKFFKYAEDRKIYEYVFQQTMRSVPPPHDYVYPFSKNQIISALVFHLKKYNVDFMTLHFKNDGNQNFKSYWDRISEHEKETKID